MKLRWNVVGAIAVSAACFFPGTVYAQDRGSNTTASEIPEPVAPASTLQPPPARPISDLHPAFKLTPAQLTTAIKIGTEAAKKGRKLDTFMNKYKQSPHWTRGNGGKSHESFIWMWGTDGTQISALAYRATLKYEDLKIPEDWKKGCYVRTLHFEVLLTSVPRVATNIFEREKAADERDVRVTKFVLSDDQGHNYSANEGSISSKDISGTVTFSGIEPHTTVEQSHTNATAAGIATGPGGTATGSAFGYSTSTYQRTQYIPWSVQKPYFQARYFVSFALFDAEGHVRIGPDVKRLTLHIINETGELTSVFPLSK